MSESKVESTGAYGTWLRATLLVAAVFAVGGALAAWKNASLEEGRAAAASQSEPLESVTIARARAREVQRRTTAIGTVVALRSITLRNEVPGTVHRVRLSPGQVVEPGTVLVALDVSVEEAELRALEAQAELAATQLERIERMHEQRAASAMELDAARAEHDVALAEIARVKAIIARKTLRAPFRARVGLSDVHPGQYLNEGTVITTLQGVEDSVYVDFSVPQQVAATLRDGSEVEIFASPGAEPAAAKIVAVDARVDPGTRNAVVRARLQADARAPAPGASVRVEVPSGTAQPAVAVPASALRRGPGGDHVFVVAEDENGQLRAHMRTVRVEALSGDEVLVVEGIAAGEQVASSGSFKLREAALVAVTGVPAVADAGG